MNRSSHSNPIETQPRFSSNLGLKKAIWRLLWEEERPYAVKEIAQLLYMGEATASSLLQSLLEENKIQRHKVTSTVNGRKISRYMYYGIEPFTELEHEELSSLMSRVYRLFVSTEQKYSAERVSALLNLAPTSTATVLYRLYKQGYLSRNKEYSGTRKRYLYSLEENPERESSYIIEVMEKMPSKGGTLKTISAATRMSIRTLKEVMLDLFKNGSVCRRRHGDYVENESLVYFLYDEETVGFHIQQLLEFKVVQELACSDEWLTLNELEEQLGVTLSRIRKVVHAMYNSFVVDRVDLSDETPQKRGYGYALTEIGKEKTLSSWDYFHGIISYEKQPAKPQ